MAKVKTKYEARVEVDGQTWLATVEYSNEERRISKGYYSKCKAVEYRMYPITIEHKDGYTVESVNIHDDRRRGCIEVKESTFRISKRKMDYFLSRADEWVHNALGKDLEINWV